MPPKPSHFTYDEVPYPIMSHSDTHPYRLATIAKLLGMTPTPVDSCRVLELGCAAGGNLIPMAEGLEKSTFVGVDYSQSQITKAQKIADAVDLSNISFHALDILGINEDFGKFDYIIAHGVYSWVPEEVREKVMQICKQNLAPNGIAYISYNTLPGYHMLMAVREMLQWHTRHATTPQERFEQSVQFIEFLGQSIEAVSAPNDAFGAFIRQYHENRFQRDHAGNIVFDESLLHDELEENNHPVYFHQFNQHAEAYGLQYVADVPFGNVMMTNIPSDIQQQISTHARDLIDLQQYNDFINNQIFRRSLLCHQDIEINRRITPDRIRDLTFTVDPRVVMEETPEGLLALNLGDRVTLKIGHPLTRAAFHILIESIPRLFTLDRLIQNACSQEGLEQPKDPDIHILLTSLLQAYTYKPALVEILPIEPPIETTITNFPKARPIARYQAGDLNQPTTTNLHHVRFTLDSFSRLVIPYLDGETDTDTLLQKIEARMQEGGIILRDTSGEPLDPEKARPIIMQQIQKTLIDLANSAILVQ